MAVKDVVENKKKVIGNNTHVQKMYWMLEFWCVNSLRAVLMLYLSFSGKLPLIFSEMSTIRLNDYFQYFQMKSTQINVRIDNFGKEFNNHK